MNLVVLQDPTRSLFATVAFVLWPFSWAIVSLLLSFIIICVFFLTDHPVCDRMIWASDSFSVVGVLLVFFWFPRRPLVFLCCGVPFFDPQHRKQETTRNENGQQ